jgi:hypothetical protein
MQLRKCNFTLLRQKSRRICVSCRVRERRRAPKGVCIRHSQLDIICTLVQKKHHRNWQGTILQLLSPSRIEFRWEKIWTRSGS